MKNTISTAFSDYFYTLLELLPSILMALIVISILWITTFYLSKIITKNLQKRKHEPILRLFLVNLFKWTMYTIGLLFALDIIGLSGVLSGVIAGASITAIVLGFAFKDIAENFLSGILLAFSSPFKTGDIIEVIGMRGRVQNIELRTTQIRSSDGRDVFLPNSSLIKNPITNFTRDGFMRHTFSFGVDTSSDTHLVRTLIQDYIKNEKTVLKSPLPQIVLVAIGDSSIEMRVSFWVNLFRSSSADKTDLGEPILSRVMANTKEILLNNGINLPAPIIEIKNYNQSLNIKSI